MGARLVGAGLALVGILAVVLGSRLTEGTETGGPGARFLPVLLGILMAAFGAAVSVQPASGGSEPGPATAGAAGQVGVTVVAVAGYVLLLERLGFLLVTAPLLAVLLRAYGERRWPVVGAVAVAATVAVYAVFRQWLGVLLPAGPLRW